MTPAEELRAMAADLRALCRAAYANTPSDVRRPPNPNAVHAQLVRDALGDGPNGALAGMLTPDAAAALAALLDVEANELETNPHRHEGPAQQVLVLTEGGGVTTRLRSPGCDWYTCAGAAAVGLAGFLRAAQRLGPDSKD